MTLTQELEQLKTEREAVEIAREAIVEMLKAKAVEARIAGWSAQKIAKTIGVSKRTIQVWTDSTLEEIFEAS